MPRSFLRSVTSVPSVIKGLFQQRGESCHTRDLFIHCPAKRNAALGSSVWSIDSAARVLVVGDVMRDEFIYGRVRARVAREAPVLSSSIH